MGSLKFKPMDEHYFESFITRAIKKECYIEVISLAHNTIEIYLQSLVMYDFAKTKKDSTNYYLKRRHILYGDSKINNLVVWTEICFLFDLLDEKTYNQIKDFNSKRNITIHRLLKAKSKDKKRETYQDIKNVARLGREIQLKLSPSQHTPEDIRRILYYFDNPNKIEEKHYDWIA